MTILGDMILRLGFDPGRGARANANGSAKPIGFVMPIAQEAEAIEASALTTIVRDGNVAAQFEPE
jgi:hypothetical protein